MIKERLTAFVAVLVAFAIFAAPVLGVQCTMSCGAGSGTCCCRGGASDGTLSYSAPSCCQPEYQAKASGNTILPDRVSSKVRTTPPVYIAQRSAPSGARPSAASEEFLRASGHPRRGRPSSPLFILNASFLI